MMARLLCENRGGCHVAAELRRVVSLIPRDVAHEVWREDVLPRKRRHIVIRFSSLVLSFLLLIGKIRHIELLIASEQIQAEEILVAGRVIKFEEALYRSAIVMK